MKVNHIEDAPLRRELERFDASQSQQDGLIDYIACMADVDMPEIGSTDEEDGHDA